MIKLIILDIDGVITDGNLYSDGTQCFKAINYKNLDAIAELKKLGYIIVAITKEKGAFTEYIENRIEWDFFYSGIENKLEVVKMLENRLVVKPQNICYVGDGRHDLEAMQYIGCAVCPQDASTRVKKIARYILPKPSDKGCIDDLLYIIQEFDNSFSQNPQNQQADISLLNGYLKRHTQALQLLQSTPALLNQIVASGLLIKQRLRNNGTVFIAGNGGSASDAQHIATEFSVRFKKNRKAYNMHALCGNVATLTAIGNDFGFNNLFSKQLEAHAKEGDVFVALTTSGKSENIIQAIEYAVKNKISVIALTGEQGMNMVISDVIALPSSEVSVVQEMSMIVGHFWALMCEEEYA